MLKHLLLDFDGTLIDSSQSILESLADALAQCGRRPAVALERSLIGPPLRETLRRASGGADEATLDRLVDAFKSSYDTRGYLKTEAFPGVATVLADVRAAGTSLFIVTNKRIQPTTRIIAHFGWEELFQGVYALDSTAPPAADKVDLVARVMRRWAIDPAAAALVGDTLDDMAAATQNGLRFGAATWGYGGLSATALDGAVVLRSPADIGSL